MPRRIKKKSNVSEVRIAHIYDARLHAESNVVVYHRIDIATPRNTHEAFRVFGDIVLQ